MSNADWWARKMREPVTPPVPMPEVRQPGRPAPMPSYPSPATPPVPMPAYSPPQARSAAQHDRCPSCGGDNFLKANSTVAARCYTCGYVEGRDYQQETFSPSPANITKATRQLPSEGYAPQQIVGRVDG